MNQYPVQRVDRLPDLAGLPQNSRSAYELVVARMADGTEISLPVNVMVGKKSSPRLLMIAGVHGNEYDGITAQLELWQELDPAQLSGMVVMVPVANSPAFRAVRRRNPADETDMNRIFPGDPHKSITYRLADRIYSEILPGSDLLLSMHGWTSNGVILPYVEYPKSGPVSDASRKAALAFGLDFIEAFDWTRGLLVEAASRAEIPSIEPEVGGANMSLPERRAVYKKGALNLLSMLGIIRGVGEATTIPSEVTRTEIAAPVGGVLFHQVVLGQSVSPGQILAVIQDFHGNALNEIRAPAAGLVATLHLHSAIEPGDIAAMLFHPIS